MGFMKKIDKIVEKKIAKPIKDLFDEIIGPFLKFFEKVGKFFAPFWEMLQNMLTLLILSVQLITTPLDFVQLLVGMVLYVIGILLSTILNFPVPLIGFKDSGAPTIGQAPLGRALISLYYRSLYLFPVAIYKSLIYAIFLIPRVILVVVVIILDSLSNNEASIWLYKALIACENSPFAWFTESFYHLGNEAESGVFFCKKSCALGYRLSEDGKRCEKIPNYVPHFCPQANVMRLYKGLSNSGAATLQEFNYNDPNFLKLSEEKRRDYIKNYKKNKKEYYNSCNLPNNDMNKYNDATVNICASYISDGSTAGNRIKELCYTSLCTNGKYNPICAKMKNFEGSQYTDNGVSKSVFLSLCKYVLIIIVLILLIYVSDKVTSPKK
jgi:hypothetical protein